ncbi:Hypothetical predicted protein [Lecanosticta acicola]|uniref:Uncharacterized protein n=1 Tax=Lecanosticta acicola TaxID=111012 RepID=A0AAI9EC88_9PEZI|nr:Hypothetical predicted protein [Lecanosticta acicola]
MLLWGAFAALLASVVAEPGCNNCTNESTDPYVLVPAPWTLKGTIYSTFLLPGLGVPLDLTLPNKTFPPLERQYPNSTAGTYVGEIGIIQLVRYTESPVGPYDEMFIVPGFYDYQRGGKTERNLRISRIYVSQKYSVWNARSTWNQPKHLARFNWTSNADGGESVKVYPFDTTGDTTESGPSEKPWFQMTFSPLLPENLVDIELPGLLSLKTGDLNPKIPFSSALYGLLGINATLTQPPLPTHKDAFGALVNGGPVWKDVVPGEYSNKTILGTMNMDQTGGDGEETGVNAVGDEFFQNFWPGVLPRTTSVEANSIQRSGTLPAPYQSFHGISGIQPVFGLQRHMYDTKS